MLAQDRETPNPPEGARRKSPKPVGQPQPTRIVDALPKASSETPIPASRRRKVTARPISQSDTRLVERATWMLETLPLFDESPASPAVIEAPTPPATREGAAPSAAITIVEGDATSSMVALRIAPPPRKKRHWLSGLVILTLIIAVALTAIATVTPLANGRPAGVAVHATGPLGLPFAREPVNSAPSGQWVAVIGIQPNQEIGGGAGPGVSAPGSAGLPIASVKTIVNTAPAIVQAAGASPAPLSPWPPAWAFVAVPGYYSFGMSDVGGYYSWTFGQCTWWAQYERRDENLMHMGNAQFWASGASARGYSVGSLPRAGATVVFQPGVQGAGGAGHVAHVITVYPDNWFLVSEMNFYWNGGGWGRVDYRFAHAGPGVQFIY